MSTEIKVPNFPESVADGTIVSWRKAVGDAVRRDEILVDIETDKVVFEVPSPADGRLTQILQDKDATVLSGQLIGTIEASLEAPATAAIEGMKAPVQANETTEKKEALVMPAAKKMIEEQQLDASKIVATGKGGRILKEDVQRHLEENPAKPNSIAGQEAAAPIDAVMEPGERVEKRVPMTRMRARIAERLLESQRTAVILTTFNEVNMKPVSDLRARYKDEFEKRHGVRLGFMSFFVKACVEALKRFPEVNASIDGKEVVYHGYFDIGIAVGSERGLVVPILRNANQLTLAGVEAQIRNFGQKAKDGSLSLEDLSGGTFTITNGGVFGSLLSTPIINPPQSAILGMHKIQDRPVVENGEIVIRPMMYVALSYDHRLIDGSGAVRFLVTVKELLEDPARMILDV